MYNIPRQPRMARETYSLPSTLRIFISFIVYFGRRYTRILSRSFASPLYTASSMVLEGYAFHDNGFLEFHFEKITGRFVPFDNTETRCFTVSWFIILFADHLYHNRRWSIISTRETLVFSLLIIREFARPLDLSVSMLFIKVDRVEIVTDRANTRKGGKKSFDRRRGTKRVGR